MPVATGYSISGVQAIATVPPVSTTILDFDFPDLDSVNRLERMGLLLICRINFGGRAQVVSYEKLFGNGLYIRPVWPLLPGAYQVAVNWYRPGLQWTLTW